MVYLICFDVVGQANISALIGCFSSSEARCWHYTIDVIVPELLRDVCLLVRHELLDEFRNRATNVNAKAGFDLDSTIVRNVVRVVDDAVTDYIVRESVLEFLVKLLVSPR